MYEPVYGGVALSLPPFTDQRETRRAATVYLQDMCDVTPGLTLTGGVRLDAYRQRIRNNRTSATGEVKDGRGWSVNGGATYVGERAGAIDGSGLRLPDYLKVKAAAEWTLAPPLTLRLKADNLLGQRYAQSSYSPVWMFPGAPRTIRASVRAAF